jgi:hypothetical protein
MYSNTQDHMPDTLSRCHHSVYVDALLSPSVNDLPGLDLPTESLDHCPWFLQFDQEQQELAIYKCGQVAAAWLLHDGITIEQVSLSSSSRFFFSNKPSPKTSKQPPQILLGTHGLTWHRPEMLGYVHAGQPG